MVYVAFFVGLVVGVIGGVLIYRNNAKKIEREAKKQMDSMKYELDRLKRAVSQRRK